MRCILGALQYSRVVISRLSQHPSSHNAVPPSPCNVCQPAQLVAICSICLRLGHRVNVTNLLTTAFSHLCNYHGGHDQVEQLFAWIESTLKFRYTRGKHILLHCVFFTNARDIFFSVTLTSISELFSKVASRSIINFIKKTGFYRKFKCMFLPEYNLLA